MKNPKGESVWVRYYDADGVLRFIMTSKENNREYYYLYECAGSELKKLGRSRSPKDLEEKFDVENKLKGAAGG